MSTATVMTFNLRRASLLDGRNAWRYRKGRAAEAIRTAAPDLVGTQEASVAMLHELSALLPGYAWLGEGRRGGTKDETNAILYREDRYEPMQHGTFWLSETPNTPGSRGWGASFPRICTWALFQSRITPYMRIAVFNTHLDHISRQARRHGAALVAERLLKLQQETGAPAILTGDFNAKPMSEAILQLQRTHQLRSAYDAEAHPVGVHAVGATYHGYRGGGEGGEPIDYIFAAGPCRLERTSVDRSRYQGRYPSDHYPVSASICWGEHS